MLITFILGNNNKGATMTVKEFLERTYKEEEHHVRDAIKCKDGLSLSVQGGTRFHYCEPRKLCNVYNKVEIGFPSRKIYSLMKYAETKGNPTGTVYGYVPIDVVERVIIRHGGIVNKL